MADDDATMLQRQSAGDLLRRMSHRKAFADAFAQVRLARQLGPGKTIVTMLCDPATRYQSRLFNPKFLRSKSLEPPAWLENPQAIEPAFA